MTDTLGGRFTDSTRPLLLKLFCSGYGGPNALAQPLVEADLSPADAVGPAGNTQMAPIAQSAGWSVLGW